MDTVSSSPKGKVLVVMSSADSIVLKEGRKELTGFFLKELGQPLIKILEAGYQPVFANVKGNPPAMDPMSGSALWFLGNYKEKNKEKDLIEKMKVEESFSDPRKLSDISDQDLKSFAGVFFPGGHAPMTDMHSDPDVGRILKYFHEASKPTGLICHAPIALLSTKAVNPSGSFLYEGYKMTCYSDAEEKANELKWRDRLQFTAESALRDQGAIIELAMPMMSRVIEDGELITGQNPSSARPFGEKFVERLAQSTT